jgi:hypothetical protein
MDVQSTNSKQNLDQHEIMARQGLRLPGLMLKQLRVFGIYCQPSISIEHQHLARRYVLRGVESGGAVAQLGAYSSFVGENGAPLSWLSRVQSVGVNGVHALVIADTLTRLQLVRVQRTYDLLITRHTLSADKERRPRLESEILFFGRRGTLEMELYGADSAYRGIVAPIFYSRAGERSAVPAHFQDAVCLMAGAVSCIGCQHCHVLQPAAPSACS